MKRNKRQLEQDRKAMKRAKQKLKQSMFDRGLLQVIVRDQFEAICINGQWRVNYIER